MGVCSSHCEVTTVISAGPDTHYACFLVGLKPDLYQQKYSCDMVTTVTRCPPGRGVVKNYGLGTKFNWKRHDHGGQLIIDKCAFTSGGTGIVSFTMPKYNCVTTHTTTALSNGDCQYTITVDGPFAGAGAEVMACELDGIKRFVQENAVAICICNAPKK